MRWLVRGSLAVVFCAAVPLRAAAQENNDLDLIPKALQEGEPAPAAPSPSAVPPPSGPGQIGPGRLYLEDAATLSSLRDHLVVPFPPPAPFDWQNRTSLDATAEWALAQHLTAALSDRFSVTEENDVDFPSRGNIRNDFREGYLRLEPLPQAYLEAGRINVRNGVSLGFNPTDFFKTRTLVDQASLDPSVVREDRLGTVMLRGEDIWAGGSASISFAPKFYSPSPVVGATALQSGLGPKFDRTNAEDRLLLTLSYEIADLSPQLLFYHESDEITRVGLNLSRQMSQSVIAYAEWAGGSQPDLIDQAISYGKRTGTLPPNLPTFLPTDSAKNFRNDAVVGASWTSENRITVNLEYHYHQAGFSSQDWRNWFAVGSAGRNSAAVTGELWFIRGFANDQQQPLARQEAFLRANWTDAFVPNLDLTAFGFVDLYDGSVLTQISANYYLTRAWTIGGYLSANVGGPRSERGSFPQDGTAIVQLIRYF